MNEPHIHLEACAINYSVIQVYPTYEYLCKLNVNFVTIHDLFCGWKKGVLSIMCDKFRFNIFCKKNNKEKTHTFHASKAEGERNVAELISGGYIVLF
jgi:hypothetical protein